MSASRLAVSGAHSGGLATTVLPAARAGAIRQVASMSGAFHGVITAVTPDGAQDTCSRCPESPGPRRRAGRASRRRTGSSAPPAASPRAGASAAARRCRRSRPGPGPRPAARSRRRSRAGSGPARRAASRPSRGRPPPAAATAASTSARPPAATSAIGCSPIGDTSVNVARRRDPLAADPVPGVHRHAGHAGRAHRRPAALRRRPGRSPTLYHRPAALRCVILNIRLGPNSERPKGPAAGASTWPPSQVTPTWR